MKPIIYYGIVVLLSGGAGYFMALFISTFKENKLKTEIRLLRAELISKKEQLGEYTED